MQFHVVGGNSLLGTSEFVSGKEGWEFRKISTEEVGWVEGKGSGQVLEGGNKEKDELCSLRMERLLGEGWNGGEEGRKWFGQQGGGEDVLPATRCGDRWGLRTRMCDVPPSATGVAGI